MTDRAPPPAARRLSILVAAALVIAEYAAISFLYDVKPLGWRSDGWRVLGQLGSIATLAVAAACGMFLVGFLGGGQRLRALLVARVLDARVFALLAVHAVLFGLFAHLSSRILAVEGPPAGSPPLWIASWLLLGSLASLTALAAAVPPDLRGQLGRNLWPLVAGGLAVGAGAWLSAQGSQLLWLPLGPWTLHSAEVVLRTLGAQVVAIPAEAILGTTAFQIHVAPECAGFEGIGLMTAFLAATLVLGRQQLRFPAALLLLPLGIVAAWTLNLFRIVVLVLIGSSFSEEIAISGFHAKAGWLLFCGLALALIALSRRLHFFSRQPTELDLAHPTAAYLVPFLTLLALSFTTGLVTIHIDLLYVVRILGAVIALVAFRRYYQDIRWTGSRAAFAGSVALGLGAFAVFVALAPRPTAPDALAWQTQWAGLPAWGKITWMTIRVLGSVIVIPIAEELAFRGYLMRRLVEREFETVSVSRRSWLALAGSSLAFGAVHGGWLGGLLAGLLFGLSAWAGGSLVHPILAHMVANAAVAVFVLVFGQWWIWM